MAFELFSDVILTRDFPESGLRAGDIGTVVEHHSGIGQEDGYSVEFFDLTGATVAVIVALESQLRSPTALDRPAARSSIK